jgi:Flp pilus assembly pilin Flp
MIRIVAMGIAIKADRRAVAALEYGLIAGLIVVTIAIGFASLANALSNQFTAIGGSL